MSIHINKTHIFIGLLAFALTSCMMSGGSNTNADEPNDSTEVSDTNAKDNQIAGFYNSKTDVNTNSLTYVTGGKNGILLTRTGYTVNWNKATRCPNWVAWDLTKNHTHGDYKRYGMVFTEDESVPKPRATDDDYFRSGYDRGHMCPSADNQWSEKAQKESFLFTNICPQRNGLDAKDWNDLEKICRHWANKYGECWIVCGPIYKNQTHKTIGKNKVQVPEEFFKVVLTKKKGNYQALGFVYENKGGHHEMSTYVRPIDEIEALTGFDFYSALPDNVETRIEAEADLEDW